MGVNSLPKTVIWTRAFCAWVQHANHSATEPPVTPVLAINRDIAEITVTQNYLQNIIYLLIT